MKALKTFFFSALVCGSGAAMAGEANPQELLNELKEIMEGDLIELTDSSITDCADFSGSWAGTCAVKIERGDDVINTTEDKTIAIAQSGCNKIEIDGKKYGINVAGNLSLSAKKGFLHGQGGVYWKDGGQALGLSKDVSGMAFKAGAPFKEMKKMAVLKPGTAAGTAQLEAVVVVKKYKDDKGSEAVEKMKATFSCPLSLGAAHH